MTPTKNTPTTNPNDLTDVSTLLGPLYGICVNAGNVIGDTLSDLIDAVFDDDND